MALRIGKLRETVSVALRHPILIRPLCTGLSYMSRIICGRIRVRFSILLRRCCISGSVFRNYSCITYI